MKPRVQSKLDAVFAYPFFQSVGKPPSGPITVINSWPLAVKHYTSRSWQNCSLIARNLLQRLTEKRSWDRSEEWNPLTDELRPLIDSFANSILPKTGIPETLIAKIKPHFSWDIMFICMECEYSDVIAPPFYLPVLDPWYAAGHLPCGWDGERFPDDWGGVIRDGRLMVF
jgi:hypothetical protein